MTTNVPYHQLHEILTKRPLTFKIVQFACRPQSRSLSNSMFSSIIVQSEKCLTANVDLPSREDRTRFVFGMFGIRDNGIHIYGRKALEIFSKRVNKVKVTSWEFLFPSLVVLCVMEQEEERRVHRTSVSSVLFPAVLFFIQIPVPTNNVTFQTS